MNSGRPRRSRKTTDLADQHHRVLTASHSRPHASDARGLRERRRFLEVLGQAEPVAVADESIIDHKSLTDIDIALELAKKRREWKTGPKESRPLRLVG